MIKPREMLIMSDLEISKALALAIGWPENQITVFPYSENVYCHNISKATGERSVGKIFNYMDWNVIGPIAARYNAFPVKFAGNPVWYSNVEVGIQLHESWENTPQKAIAMAILESLK